MKNILIGFMTILFFQSLYAKELSLNYNDYDSAHSGDKKIIFHMESTKAGLITTSFDGVVKEGSIVYKEEKGQYRDVVIRIKAMSLDTDNDARNEKMYEETLAVKKYPEIIVSLNGPIKFNQENIAIIKIRGQEYPIKIFMRESHNEKQTLISGHSNVSIKALKIPDPSIWIASVRDLVEIKFTFVL
ncbi:YceI family protein [Halobacteriovorax sp.]|uniref:YceI family protein n=1 Tax=Halobacteriovorax sp. TaxID=2020862 RepID=UPI003AF2A27F